MLDKILHFLLLISTLAFIASCSIDDRIKYAPSIGELYHSADIDGLYTTGSGLSGCDLAIQKIKYNKYIITSQQWSDIVRFERNTVTGTLINGLLKLDSPLKLARFGEEDITNVLFIYNNGEKPLLFSNPWANKNLENEGLIFHRKSDYIDGLQLEK